MKILITSFIKVDEVLYKPSERTVKNYVRRTCRYYVDVNIQGRTEM